MPAISRHQNLGNDFSLEILKSKKGEILNFKFSDDKLILLNIPENCINCGEIISKHTPEYYNGVLIGWFVRNVIEPEQVDEDEFSCPEKECFILKDSIMAKLYNLQDNNAYPESTREGK